MFIARIFLFCPNQTAPSKKFSPAPQIALRRTKDFLPCLKSHCGKQKISSRASNRIAPSKRFPPALQTKLRQAKDFLPQVKTAFGAFGKTIFAKTAKNSRFVLLHKNDFLYTARYEAKCKWDFPPHSRSFCDVRKLVLVVAGKSADA